MGDQQRVSDLQIGQDLQFQRRQWTVQRIGWLIMLLIVVAGFVGLFGSGPLSHARAEADSLRLEYDRFQRKRTMSELAVDVGGEATQEGEFRLWLNKEFLDRFDIQGISPEPNEFEAAADRAVYVFQASDPGQPARVSFAIEPDQPGGVEGRLGLVGGSEVVFGQFIYP